MRKLLTAATLLGLSAIALFAYAQSGGCVQDGLSVVCAPPGGNVVKDGMFMACGRGQCVKDGLFYSCSTVPGGGAVMDGLMAKCVGGCERPRAEYCVKPE